MALVVTGDLRRYGATGYGHVTLEHADLFPVGVVRPSPNAELEAYPLSTVRDCLLDISAVSAAFTDRPF